MSGNKLVLYFAAESENQAQNWMKEVRDGLWPSCFSFQILTACSHEVSLIDDENTFLSGLLGVYGRFVLTSEDVISLMHPHWGSTLLQISLSNVKDVLLVREAETPPAGVFNILFKRNGDFKVKALQFFCDTALDAIQWILNKIYAKYSEKSKENSKSKFLAESSTFASKDTVSPKTKITEKLESRITDSSHVIPSSCIERNDDSTISTVDCSPEYENLQYLKKNSDLHMKDCIKDIGPCFAEHSIISTRQDLIGSNEQILLNPLRTNSSQIGTRKETNDNQYLVRELSNSKLNEDNNYANVTQVMDSTNLKSQSYSHYIVKDKAPSKDSNIRKASEFISNESFGLNKKSVAPEILNDTSNCAMYSTVNKQKNFKGSSKRIMEEQILNELSKSEERVENNDLLKSKNSKLDDPIFSSRPSSTKLEIEEINSAITSSNNNLTDYFASDLRTESEKPVKDNVSTFLSPCDSNIHGVVNKQMTLHSISDDTQSARFFRNNFTLDQSLNTIKNHLLPNISGDFLNTSFTISTKFRNKTSSECSSSDEDTETLPWAMDEFMNLDIGDRIYEDILDRKGTTYEEIDTSESDDECIRLSPPSLPIRPQNLEIPNSLRLQMLSKNIKQTLEVMDSTTSSATAKEYPRPKLIKKIKEVGRIMQISPNQETSREPFTIERKLPADTAKNLLILKPKAAKPLVNIGNRQNGNASKTRNTN